MCACKRDNTFVSDHDVPVAQIQMRHVVLVDVPHRLRARQDDVIQPLRRRIGPVVLEQRVLVPKGMCACVGGWVDGSGYVCGCGSV